MNDIEMTVVSKLVSISRVRDFMLDHQPINTNIVFRDYSYILSVGPNQNTEDGEYEVITLKSRGLKDKLLMTEKLNWDDMGRTADRIVRIIRANSPM